MTLRAAIIGAGSIAGEHARILHAAGERVALVAAADVDMARLTDFCATHFIPRGYATPEDLLHSERPDLVHICTPPGTHAALAVQCLEAGASVWCEKPLCGSLAELDRIEAAERASGRFTAGVVQWRFGSAAKHLKRLIEEGVPGRPLLGLCQTTWYRDAAYYSAPWRGRWDSELGGATVGQGIHAMDLLLWLLGGWREVSATIATLDHKIAVDDASVATLRFDGGALATVVSSVCSPHEETRLRLDFQRATFEVACLYAYGNSHWTCTPAPDAEDVAAAWRAIGRDVPGTHAAQLDDTLDAIEAGGRPPASAQDLRPTIELMSALYKSSATRQPVARGSIQPGDPFYERFAGSLAR
ncbi:MAG TPA: Gfo/Idh/MocA family oxidoreductase [Candidatus Limnocylindrales bacterium]|nr:Gfo/Idh/MocA family oxidoreductase [Candidatus Limnocylindrales bacterium]